MSGYHGNARFSGQATTPVWLSCLLGSAVALIAVLTVAGLWVLRPTGEGPTGVLPSADFGAEVLHGTIVSVSPLDCANVGAPEGAQEPTSPSGDCGRARVRLGDGADAGSVVAVDLPPDARREGAGTPLLVLRSPGTPGTTPYTYYDIDRGTPLAAFAVLFVLVVVTVARSRGLRSLIGLGFAALVVVKFLLPGLLEGRNPVTLGLTTAAAIMIVVLYLAHGISARTTTALLGTFAGLGITAALGALAVGRVHLTGVSGEEDQALLQIARNVDLRGMLICGIILAGLGVLNDVTITQSSAVWELHEAAPGLPRRQLYRQAMRIGRDHIASTVYTVVFAYAGAALSVLVLISLYDQPLVRTLTSTDIAEELVRTMAGAIGLVLAVPATTALAVLAVKAIPAPEQPAAAEQLDGATAVAR